MPLDIARKLYADPIGVTDIRVGGDCGCPAPEGHCITWINSVTLKQVHRRFDDKGENQEEAWAIACKKYDFLAGEGAKHEWAEDPSAVPGVQGFIMDYHVDTGEGLRLLADQFQPQG